MTLQVVAPGVVEQVRESADGYGLVMRAENIRQQRTGLHAKLTLWATRTKDDKRRFLAYTTCNIERDEDRTKLLNTARRQGAEWAELVMGPKEDQVALKKFFDLFCLSVWDTLQAVGKPLKVKGEMLGPMEYIVEHLVLKNGGTILFGPGGSGKSTTAFLAAIAADSGSNGIWKTVETKTLVVNLERSHESIVRRIFAANCALGLEPDRPLHVLTARGKSLASLEPILRDYIREHKIGMVVLDSISRARLGKLTDDDTATELIDILNSFGIAWLAIGHTSKDNSNETFGSVHYGNGADITAKLTSERQGKLHVGVRIEIKKANDIAFPPPMTLKYTFDEDYGLHGVQTAQAGEFEELEPKVDKDTIVEYILEKTTYAKATATQIAGAIGMTRSNVARILKNDPLFIEVGHVGREVFYGIASRDV